MLLGIHPLLTGTILARLDNMGHSDSVVIADANFPAERLDSEFIDVPRATAADVVHAVCTVLPIDEAPARIVMASPDGDLPIHSELAEASGGPVTAVGRHEFYELAATASLVIRTGETRPFGNLLLRKGVVA